MKGRLMTSRISKEKPGMTERLDYLRVFVVGKDTITLSVSLPRSHTRNSRGLIYPYSVLRAQ